MRTVAGSWIWWSSLTVASALAGDVKVFPGARFDEKTWNKLQSYEARELSRNFNAHVGQLIELHFQFRSRDVRHLKPNWHQSAVWQSARDGKRGFASVPVMVAAGDVNSFKQFTADSRATTDLKVYGQVLYDFGANFVFVKLLGTSAFLDQDGFVNVSW